MVENKQLEIEEQIASLQAQGFTKPLARYVCERVVEVFPLRMWIVDNSFSMGEQDGRKLVDTATPSDVRWEVCTRWEELKECVLYHAQMAALLQAPTQFHLLNAPPSPNLSQSCGIGEMGVDMVERELLDLQETLDTTFPAGGTPLVLHLRRIQNSIRHMAPSLQRYGQKVAVVVATDGKPTDAHGYSTQRELEVVLREFQQLPVWMVIRLCTNDETVVSYYQSLDEQLELNLEVLDDYMDESKEVYELNPFLNYALVLHRCREMGFPNKLFDLLDERRLSLEEVKDLVELVLVDDDARNDELAIRPAVPDPHADWKEFQTRIQQLSQSCPSRPWNPIRRRVRPWFDTAELERTYRPIHYYTRVYGKRLFVACSTTAALFIAVDWEDVWDWIVVEVTSNGRLQGMLSMALGVVALMVVLGRDPRALLDWRLLMGALVAALSYCWRSQPAEFWQGLCWMVFGAVLLVGTILWTLRPRI